MANPLEICQVTANGSIFQDWTAVSVAWSADDWRRIFSLELAEPGAAKSGQFQNLLRLKPGDDIDIALAGIKAIIGGKVVTRQAAYDKERHGVRVDGFSKAGDISYSSAEIKGGQYRNHTLSSIANDQLKRFGIKFSLEGAPPGAQEKFKNVIINHGETVSDLLERLARQRDVLLTSDAKGNIIAGLGSKGSGSQDLEEGKNILSARATITDEAVASEVKGRTQTSGSDESFGKPVSQISAIASIFGVNPNRKWVVAGEEPNTTKEMQMRVNADVRRMLASMIRVTVIHKGWFRPGTNRLWEAREGVTLRSPMLFPVGDGSMPLAVWEIVCSQDNAQGSITTLQLVSKAAMEQKFANAQGPDPFSPGAQEAEPET